MTMTQRPLGFRAAGKQWINDGKNNQFAVQLALPLRNVAPPTLLGGNAFRVGLDTVGAEPYQADGITDVAVPYMNLALGSRIDAGLATIAAGEASQASAVGYTSGMTWFPRSLIEVADVLDHLDSQLGFAADKAFERDTVNQILADTQVTQQQVTASTATVTGAELVNLVDKLPEAFGSQQFILLRRSAFTAVMKDGSGALRPHPDPERSGVALLADGTPIVRCDSLQPLGVAGQVVGLAISAAGLSIVDFPDARKLTRYEDISTRPDQVGLALFAYSAAVWHPSAIAKLKTP